jgi:antitoxin PrlF
MTTKIPLQSESTLTDRYQTTVPEDVRKVLGLNKRDKIRYIIQPDGQVILSRVDGSESDPVLEKFLNLLAQDLQDNPEHIQAIEPALVKRAQALVADIVFDLDAPLSDKDE